MLDAFLSKGISPNLKMIVLDNYGHEGLFPQHHDKLVIDSPRDGKYSHTTMKDGQDLNQIIHKKTKINHETTDF